MIKTTSQSPAGRNRQSGQGFTLLELMVVIGIIGILVALAGAAVQHARYKAKEAKALSDLKLISDAAMMLANDCNLWPGAQAVNETGTAADNEICGADANGADCGARTLSASLSGLLASDGSFTNWNGPYLNSIPLDPWGREYFFDTDYSTDADNQPCGCGGGGCTDAVVMGSYGQDMAGKPVSTAAGAYGCDDIIKIIYKN